ncbi:hypothetical protein GCM10007103_27170 [Salinimicrobium marinum]|uniref:Uncharacterized protein n=1 Tax=Salinimicrobium marinum TaxID=680283 RepID=A0A918SIA6_9FLAO|nr:hypothetical protein GCM10007103_27170 [Salinimicrobium marinum]
MPILADFNKYSVKVNIKSNYTRLSKIRNLKLTLQLHKSNDCSCNNEDKLIKDSVDDNRRGTSTSKYYNSEKVL